MTYEQPRVGKGEYILAGALIAVALYNTFSEDIGRWFKNLREQPKVEVRSDLEKLASAEEF